MKVTDNTNEWNEDFEVVIGGFIAPHTHNNRPASHEEGAVRALIAGMRARPGDYGPMTAGSAWNLIYDHHLMFTESNSGWITREGYVLGAAYAAHERLLNYLGILTRDAEAWGWVRFSRIAKYKCMFRLSPAQKEALEECGLLIDSGEEMLKPAFPGREAGAWSELPDETRMLLEEKAALKPERIKRVRKPSQV